MPHTHLTEKDYYMSHTFTVSGVREDAKENIKSYGQHTVEDTVANVDPEYWEPTVYTSKDICTKRNVHH